MSRYNKTDRSGVNKVEGIVINDLGWVFREQPIADVGIDAIIEQTIDEDPTGKFVAIQIKTGESHFHITEKYLTYYVSNVHYNYWLQLDFPIILVAYLPESDSTYWKVINKSTLLKTKKKWKIKIPKLESFDKSSINQLSKLLSKQNIESLVSELYESDFEANFSIEIEFINTIDSLKKIGGLLKDVTNISNSAKSEIDKFVAEKRSYRDDPKVIATFKKCSRSYSLASKRLEQEIIIFSRLYPEELLNFVKYLRSVFCNSKNELILIEPIRKEAEVIQNHFINSLNSFESMKVAAEKLPTSIPTIKKSRSDLIDVIDMLQEEYIVAKELFENLILNE